jgi:hypothetical protein
MTPSGQERRASERTQLGLACVYVLQEPVAPEQWEFHQGLGRVLNMARGGMLVLLDHQPQIQQLIQVHVNHSNTDQTISLLRVAWTRRVDNGGQHWAGCKFLYGPYSLSQDRICPPTEFVSPS